MNITVSSLRERISAATELTRDVIDDRNILAQLLLDSDLVEAFEVAQQTIAEAFVLRYASGEAQALIHAGTSAARRHLYDEAIILLGRARRIREELNDTAGVAGVIARMGNTELRAGNYSRALDHYSRAIDMLGESDDDLTRANLHGNSALILGMQGNYTLALRSHLSALKIFEANNAGNLIAGTLANIGLIYIEQKNYDEAMKVFDRALTIRRASDDKLATSDLLNNIGIVYQEQGKYEQALASHNEALNLRSGDNIRTATSYSNLGNVYKKISNNELAKDFYERSLSLFDSISDKRGLLQSYNNLGELYYEQKEYEKSERYLDAAVKLAQDTGLKVQLRQAYEYLSFIYAHRRQFEKAYQVHRLFSKLDREISDNEVKNQLSQMSLHYELEQKEQAAELERIKNAELQSAYDLLDEEKKRSESLLLNILPLEVSNELKESGKTRARSHDMVTVLFTDIKSFTKVSEQFSAEEIVSSIDEYFEQFDRIMERHGIEKIKTIGDAYLCVAGMPLATPDHAERMIYVAREMMDAVRELRAKREAQGKHAFDFRVGINSGPVVAGVVGIKKFAYDIWGDTVNTASRMQANGEPQRINISEATYLLVRDKFKCSYRGEIEAKNKGKLKMYFVED